MTTVRDFSGMTTQTLHGGQVGLSYQGPIHFGLSSSSHPFRTDRIWKQVHAGLGYDLPLHELAPGKVSARASSGPRGGLNIEIETPFHRTDRKHLRGIEASISGFETTGSEAPGGDAEILGQWMMRSNLWSPGSDLQADISTVLDPSGEELHGPATDGLTGGQAWEPLWFWDDHPTDRFHAGAVPISTERTFGGSYGDFYLGRADLTHPLDWIANSEQLLSSVDVHINIGTKPMWDSGSIVSAQGIGHRDSSQGSRIEGQMGAFYSESASGQPVPESNPWGSYGGSTTSGHGLGLGQRILRTNDGTLHQFVLGRSATKDNEDESTPVWIHHKKPLHGDLFWSSREQKANDFAGSPPTWGGKDECGPDISSLIGSVTDLRVHGAAFAADSEGTIHAVIEVCDSTNSGHSLYYHSAKRVLVAYNPDPVYDWRWDNTTATRILGASDGTERAYGEDFREPTLAVDHNDVLHLAYVQPAQASGVMARIYYTQKRSNEDWSAFDATTAGSGLRHRLVSHPSTDSDDGTEAPFSTPAVDKPKICLRGDSVPVVFYRGSHASNGIVTRRASALFVNVAEKSGDGGSSSLFNFSSEASYMVGGQTPAQSDVTISTNGNDGVRFYDALIDEQDRAWAIYVMPLDTGGQVNGSGEPIPYLTRLCAFDARVALSDQWSSTEGLGLSTTLFHSPPTVAGDRGLDPAFHSPTITTDGGGNIHVVAVARYNAAYSTLDGGFGSDRMVLSGLLRDDTSPAEHAPYPLQMPGVKAGDQSATTTYPNQDDEGGYGPETSTLSAEIDEWPGEQGAMNSYEYSHLLEMWWPAHEYSTPASGEWVIRSVNFRWLSVPSMRWNATTQSFVPLGQADTISGNEDFLHTAPQLRMQRYHGFSSEYLDLSWITNERSWISTPHSQSAIMWPHSHPGNVNAEPSSDSWEDTDHRLGVPGHPVEDAP